MRFDTPDERGDLARVVGLGEAGERGKGEQAADYVVALSDDVLAFLRLQAGLEHQQVYNQMEVLIKRSQIVKLVNDTVKEAFVKSIAAISDSIRDFILKELQGYRAAAKEDCQFLLQQQRRTIQHQVLEKVKKLDFELGQVREELVLASGELKKEIKWKEGVGRLSLKAEQFNERMSVPTADCQRDELQPFQTIVENYFVPARLKGRGHSERKSLFSEGRSSRKW